MQPNDPSRPSIDPRQVIEHHGVEGLATLLSAVGYIPQRRILRDLKHSLRSRKPLLIEGPRGGGKTQLAEALAEACNLTTFYLQGTEELTLADVLYSWDREEQRELVEEERRAGTSRAERQAKKYTREFLILGEALGAFDYAGSAEVPPILIIDEADKLTEKIEDMLLQLLGRGWASVPRLRCNIGVTDPGRWPVVIILSNNIRHELSAPLRSRCIYHWLEPPTPLEEVCILHTRVPEASPSLLRQLAKIINHIRLDMPQVRDKPGLRESIDLLKILVQDGIEELTAEVIEEYLSFLGKKPKELRNLKEGTGRLEWAARQPETDIDELVWRLCGQDENPALEEAA
ncbi:MAG: MoxR family ATPase [Acidobacteriota bacterium]|nr:MoxR family ATPase [Acidobacteriota bacterium]